MRAAAMRSRIINILIVVGGGPAGPYIACRFCFRGPSMNASPNVLVFAVRAARAAPLAALLLSSRALPQGASQCLDSIPSSALIRVPVYLDVRTPAGSSRAFQTPLAYYTQAVARRLQSHFRMHGDTLGEGEPAVTWRDAGKHVAMTAFPNGELRGSIEGDPQD